ELPPNIDAAKQKGVDHLLKTFTTTTRQTMPTRHKPAQTIRTCRGQLHSPLQAAVALARILGIYGRHTCRNSSLSLNPDQASTTQSITSSSLTPDFAGHQPLSTDYCHTASLPTHPHDATDQSIRDQLYPDLPATQPISLNLQPETSNVQQKPATL